MSIKLKVGACEFEYEWIGGERERKAEILGLVWMLIVLLERDYPIKFFVF